MTQTMMKRIAKKRREQETQQQQQQPLVLASASTELLHREFEGRFLREQKEQETLTPQQTGHLVVVKGKAGLSHMQSLKSKVIPITMEMIARDRHRYPIPSNQRPGISSVLDKSMLMYSLYIGAPIGEMILVQGRDPDTQETIYWVDNGGQRKRDICDIYDGRVRMPTQKQLYKRLPNSQMPVVTPGKTLKQMSVQDRDQILTRTLSAVILDEFPAPWFADLWILTNWHHPVQMGNRLAARISHTANTVRRLNQWEESDYWYRVWTKSPMIRGDMKGTRFASTLAHLMIASCESPYRMTFDESEMSRWASGMYDARVTEQVVARVIYERQCIAQLFQGVQTRSRSDIIVQAQLVRYLEDAGYDLLATPLVQKSIPSGVTLQGALVDWLNEIRLERKWSSAVDGGRPYSIVTHVMDHPQQDKLWESQLPLLLARAESEELGLVRKQ